MQAPRSPSLNTIQQYSTDLWLNGDHTSGLKTLYANNSAEVAATPPMQAAAPPSTPFSRAKARIGTVTEGLMVHIDNRAVNMDPKYPVVLDVSGNGNHAYRVGIDLEVHEHSGIRGLRTNGGAGYLQVPALAQYDWGSGFSACVVFMFHGYSTYRQGLLSNGHQDFGSWEILLQRSGTTSTVMAGVRVNGQSTFFPTEHTFSESETFWSPHFHQVCLTFDGQNSTMYLDGDIKTVAEISETAFLSQRSHPVVIAASVTDVQGQTINPFEGNIGDIHIYNRELQPDEAVLLWSATAATISRARALQILPLQGLSGDDFGGDLAALGGGDVIAGGVGSLRPIMDAKLFGDAYWSHGGLYLGAADDGYAHSTQTVPSEDSESAIGFSAWMYWDDDSWTATGSYPTVVGVRRSKGPALTVRDGYLALELSDRRRVASSPLQTHRWHHVAAQWPGGDISLATLVVDGIEVDAVSSGAGLSPSPTDNAVVVGRSVRDGSLTFFKGYLRDVHVYLPGAPAAGMRYVYNRGMFLDWPLRNGSGTTVAHPPAAPAAGGTLSGGAQWMPNGYIRCGQRGATIQSADSVGLFDAITASICLWFHADVASWDDQPRIELGGLPGAAENGNTTAFQLVLLQGRLAVDFGGSALVAHQESAQGLASVQRWHHACVTKELGLPLNSTTALYLDGVLLDAATLVPSGANAAAGGVPTTADLHVTNAPLRLCTVSRTDSVEATTGDVTFRGYIDSVGVYMQALSATLVSTIHAEQVPSHGSLDGVTHAQGADVTMLREPQGKPLLAQCDMESDDDGREELAGGWTLVASSLGTPPSPDSVEYDGEPTSPICGGY